MLTAILHKDMSGISETVTATDFGLGKCVGFFLHYMDQDVAIYTSRELSATLLVIKLVY